VKVYEDLRSTYEAILRENSSIKLQNEMLSLRVTDRSNKLEEVLQTMRERSITGSSLTEHRSEPS
jgi:hypothetical protein